MNYFDIAAIPSGGASASPGYDVNTSMRGVNLYDQVDSVSASPSSEESSKALFAYVFQNYLSDALRGSSSLGPASLDGSYSLQEDYMYDKMGEEISSKFFNSINMSNLTSIRSFK